jgi:hypothetical protein
MRCCGYGLFALAVIIAGPTQIAAQFAREALTPLCGVLSALIVCRDRLTAKKGFCKPDRIGFKHDVTG